MKLLVSVAVSREWSETEFLKQVGRFQAPIDWQVKFGMFQQFTAAERHNVMAGEAFYNYDRLIFMDTDQIYPHDYLVRMLKHDEPVVTALNVSRYYPFEVTTYKITDEKEYDGIIIPHYEEMSLPANKRIFECDLTGTGGLMLDPKILQKLTQPYFKDIYDKEGCRRLLPDDFYFCWQLYKAGIKIVVDQSIIIGHTGKLTINVFNREDMKKAWQKVNSGWGITKDGKAA